MPIDRHALLDAMKKSVLANQAAGHGTELVRVFSASLLPGLMFLCDRIDELEKRIEEQPFAYDGPHETGKAYRKGTFVTHGGGLWHCNYATASRPGDGPAWTLAVKHGRDLR